ncbi:unnamed protein product, partial [Linum tenue]
LHITTSPSQFSSRTSLSINLVHHRITQTTTDLTLQSPQLLYHSLLSIQVDEHLETTTNDDTQVANTHAENHVKVADPFPRRTSPLLTTLVHRLTSTSLDGDGEDGNLRVIERRLNQGNNDSSDSNLDLGTHTRVKRNQPSQGPQPSRYNFLN